MTKRMQDGGEVFVREKPLEIHSPRGGLSVFSMLRRPDAPSMSDEEHAKLMSWMQEQEDDRELTRKMGTGKYWWDTIKHLPAAFLARMKKINPETGEVRWLGSAPMPDLDDVGRGLMTMEEYRAELAAAKAYNEAGRDFHSTWVDDTKSMAAIPAILGNVMGGDFEPPEFAVEAAGRVGQVVRDTQEDFGLEDPTGLPQHLSGGLGAMMTQIPVPGTQGKGALTQSLTRKIPQGVQMAAKPVTLPLRALVEMANPTINPGLKTYAMGTAASGLLDTALEPSGEDIRELERLQEQQQQFADMDRQINDISSSPEAWDSLDMETKITIMHSPFAMTAMENLTDEQQQEMIDTLIEMGAFDDAEQE